ncbi:MAG: anthranilate phosphoribosyltransferase [Planctomycetes bacterium]|nr:anthranilate phosphoribosyltransferase [Planctomycetota bacterium]
MNFNDALEKLRAGQSLTREEAKQVFSGAFQEGADQDALAELLTILAERGETVAEITGAAEALRGAMLPFEHDATDAVDTCGTGGDKLGSFNLSTASALVAASAGAKVIKHGNRSVSSQCGSADLLEAAGMRLELTPKQAQSVFRQEGIVFLFAPAFHPAMRFVAPVRAKLGIRTIFNFLGPICNPGGVKRHLLGVSDPDRIAQFAGVLEELNFERAYVVHGAGGADELTLAGPNQVQIVGAAPAQSLNAEDLGLQHASVEELEGGDPICNLKMLHRLLDGKLGPIHDAVCLNAAAALLAAGITNEVQVALERSKQAIANGDARRKLGTWIATTHLAAEGQL